MAVARPDPAEPLSPVEAAIARLLRAAWVVEQRERAERRRRMHLVEEDDDDPG